MLLGMQLNNTERHGNTSFLLGVDNQATIQASRSESDPRRPGHRAPHREGSDPSRDPSSETREKDEVLAGHLLDSVEELLNAISKNGLSREAASLAQFRLSHAPDLDVWTLGNFYLKRIRKVDSARCPACGTDEETIEHYLPAILPELRTRKMGSHPTSQETPQTYIDGNPARRPRNESDDGPFG